MERESVQGTPPGRSLHINPKCTYPRDTRVLRVILALLATAFAHRATAYMEDTGRARPVHPTVEVRDANTNLPLVGTWMKVTWVDTTAKVFNWLSLETTDTVVYADSTGFARARAGRQRPTRVEVGYTGYISKVVKDLGQTVWLIPSRPRLFSGQVVNGYTQRPVAGAVVRCGHRRTRTDGRGRFRLRMLCGSSARLTATANGLPLARSRIVKDASGTWHVSFELFDASATGSAFGRVTDLRTGEPLRQSSVCVVNADKGAAADSLGYYLIGGLAPGRHELTASYIGFYDERIWVDIEPVSIDTVNVRLRPYPFY